MLNTSLTFSFLLGESSLFAVFWLRSSFSFMFSLSLDLFSERKDVNPGVLSNLNTLCITGFLKSESTNKTFLPKLA